MKTEKKNSKERLEFFRSLYENAKDAYSDILDEFDKNIAQYSGSMEIDGGKEKAITRRKNL